MVDRIVMEVSRYRPEIESAPVLQAYEVPLTREWAILDGLNYIKDQLDGTLSFRWSCRMGICGSCGIHDQRRPEIGVRDVPRGLPARAGTSGADAKLPGDPRSRRRHQRLHGQTAERQALDHPGGRAVRRGRRIPADPSRNGRVQEVQHVHQLHAVLLGMPRVRAGPGLPRSGGDRAGSALQPGLARRRRGGSQGRARRGRRRLGVHLGGRMLDGLSEGSRSGRRDPALQADRRNAVGEESVFPRGAR